MNPNPKVIPVLQERTICGEPVCRGLCGTSDTGKSLCKQQNNPIQL